MRSCLESRKILQPVESFFRRDNLQNDFAQEILRKQNKQGPSFLTMQTYVHMIYKSVSAPDNFFLFFLPTANILLRSIDMKGKRGWGGHPPCAPPCTSVSNVRVVHPGITREAPRHVGVGLITIHNKVEGTSLYKSNGHWILSSSVNSVEVHC